MDKVDRMNKVDRMDKVDRIDKMRQNIHGELNLELKKQIVLKLTSIEKRVIRQLLAHCVIQSVSAKRVQKACVKTQTAYNKEYLIKLTSG